VLCGLHNFTLLVDKLLIFSLRNVKEVTLYSMVNSLLLWTIFIYDSLHGVYMELLLDLPLLFIGDVSMVSMDVHFSQPSDEDTMPMDVKPWYYCHDPLKPLEVSPFHVVFGLRGVLARQGQSFKPCILSLVEWYKNLSANPYVIPRPNLLEFMQRCLQ